MQNKCSNQIIQIKFIKKTFVMSEICNQKSKWFTKIEIRYDVIFNFDNLQCLMCTYVF